MGYQTLITSSKILLPVLVILLLAQQNIFAGWLFWEPGLIIKSQWWRIITSNLTHTNDYHLLINTSVLIFFVINFSDMLSVKRFWFLTLYLSTFIGFALIFTDIQSYVGFSGVMHGLFIWAAVTDIYQRRFSGWILFIGVSIKLGYDQIYGPSVTTSELIRAKVAVEAHMAGALAGFILPVTEHFYITMHKHYRSWFNSKHR